MSTPTIQEELALVYKKAPDFAGRVIAAIEEGRINSSGFHTCFYGQVCHGDDREAQQLCHAICKELGIPRERYASTPIEGLLTGVGGNETYETHREELATLHEALQPYLLQD